LVKEIGEDQQNEEAQIDIQPNEQEVAEDDQEIQSINGQNGPFMIQA
jgi:hypothetical protein